MKPKSKAAQRRAAKNVGADLTLGVACQNGQRVPVRGKPQSKPLAALLGRLNHKEK